jgi:phosphoserine phosphatase RsbU/P
VSVHAERHNRKPVVWITDDSAIESLYTERALGSAYEFEHFRDGSHVIERLASGGPQPDVLLLDWVMPSVSGDEVCRFLRSRPDTEDLPIIIVTASRVETSDVVQGLTIGANDYVARPFVAEELRARVDTAIRAKRLRDIAQRERMRLFAVAKLGRAFIDIGPRTTSVLEVLAKTLTESLADGCSIIVTPGATAGYKLVAHRDPKHQHALESFGVMDPASFKFESDDAARKALPTAYHAAIDRYGMSSLAVIPFPVRGTMTGVVTIMRDGSSPPFEDEDLATVRTCTEYAAMAFENAMRFDAERIARRELQAILEYVPVGIVVADAMQTVTYVNQKALEIVPKMRQARTIAELYQDVAVRTETGTVDSATGPLARALRGETTRGGDAEVSFDDGASKHLRVSAAPLRDADGRIDSAILVFEDVSVEHAVEEERARAEKFQQLVLGIVSHDLRTPLQTLLMGAEGIKRLAADQPKLLAFADRMENTTRRMTGIINQLLDVVRTQSGSGVPIDRRDLELDKLVKNVVDEMTLAYPAAKLEAKLEPVHGLWDPDRLGQVVMNLIGNAIQHGVKSAPIMIETARHGESAVFRVRNGSLAPLSAEQISTLFDAFKRGTSSTKTGGLGLGLYISKEIVRAHQGDINVVSDTVTTTFEVRLPLSSA